MSFSQKQDGRTVATRHSRGAPRADAEAEATDSEPEAHVMEPLAADHSSDSEDAPTGVVESAAATESAAMSLLERLQATRITHGSTSPT